MFCDFRHVFDCLRNGEGTLTPHSKPGRGYPSPHRRTLTPLIPLSLKALKGEGEEKTEGSACAMAQALPSSLVLVGEGEGERRTAPTSASSSVLRGRERVTEGSRVELRSWVWLFRRDGFPTPRE